MLSVTEYSSDYMAACRARIDVQLAAYRELAAAAGKQDGGDDAVAAFAPPFFANLVLALDMSFCHRARGQEGKDGNPMNEVRMLCTSILQNGGVLLADKQIRLKPETSVLGLAVGDEIRLSEADFVALSDAYFDAVARTYGA